jgi:NitT/TauT family transport system ATP-binding protein
VPEGPRGIAFRGVGFCWEGGARQFEGLDLELPAGEVTAVVGPSGCGKSTLLRLALGLLAPREGRVEAPVGARAMVPQAPTLLPWRSALDNVALPLELQGTGEAERRAAARSALARVGLQGAEALLPHALSGGMKMRVSLARALVTAPVLMGLDEPFSALDAETRRRAREEFQRVFAAAPCTALLVTHELEEAVLLGHRVAVLGPAPAGLRGVEAVAAPWPRAADFVHEAAALAQVARLRALL